MGRMSERDFVLRELRETVLAAIADYQKEGGEFRVMVEDEFEKEVFDFGEPSAARCTAVMREPGIVWCRIG